MTIRYLPRFILITFVLLAGALAGPAQLVSAGVVDDPGGVAGQRLIEVSRTICGNDRQCQQDFVASANTCRNTSNNVTAAGLADCVIASMDEYNMADRRDDIIEGMASAFSLQSQVTNDNENITPCSSTLLGFPAWNNGLDCPDGKPAINKLNDLWVIVLNMVRWLLAVAAYGAAIFVIWGGFKYIKSQGDPSSVANAKTTITQAIGGLFIALIASALVWFVQGLIR